MIAPCCVSRRHRDQAPAIAPGDVVQASPLVVGGYAGITHALVVSSSATGGATALTRTRRYLLWWFSMGSPVLGQSLQTVPVCELRRVGDRQVLGADARAYLTRIVHESECRQSPDILAALA